VVLVVLYAFVLTAASALALPAGRVYEQVSPVYKGGYGANQLFAVAPSGESASFFSKGAFDGVSFAPSAPFLPDYAAHRTSTGWTTAPLLVPIALTPQPQVKDVDSSLGSVLGFAVPGASETTAEREGTEGQFLTHELNTPNTVENWHAAGPVLKSLTGGPLESVVSYKGASADLCHLYFAGRTSEPLLPVAIGEPSEPIYELSRGCGTEPQSLNLVNLNNSGGVLEPSCTPALGSGDHQIVQSEQLHSFNAIADDGGEVFFTTCTNGVTGNRLQLFVRLGGERTVEVSRPLLPTCAEVPCGKAHERTSSAFVGASEDGSKVFFTSTASLTGREETGEEPDTGKRDLYMASIGCPSGKLACSTAEREVNSLIRVSEPTVPGEAAEVQGAVRVAPDGSRIYFVAQGVLTKGVNPEGRAPVKGADNLYVYDSVSGTTVYITDLCSGPESSGAAENVHCPSSLKGNNNDSRLIGTTDPEAQTSDASGKYLVFASFGQLTPDDTDTAQDVYRYDAEIGTLTRVSLGEHGHSANGNSSAFDATITLGHSGGRVEEQFEMNNRAITEDGSRIIFETAEPLSSEAINGLQNVYEWHASPSMAEGQVALVSGGRDSEPVSSPVITPSGRDIFFVTAQGLVPQDTDGARDVYDARLGGGFSAPPEARQPCSGDACQGPLTNSAPLLVPGSLTQAPGQNLTAPSASAPSRVVVAPRKRACRRGYRRGKRDRCVRAKKRAHRAASRPRAGRPATTGASS
jgi:hypothetical protein